MESQFEIRASLEDIIKEKAAMKPISFNEFMEACLYYPDYGYYTSANKKIGREGDYYTSASISPAFGAMIARQLEEMWVAMGKCPFTIAEYGAGTGMLCHDILHYLKYNEKMYCSLRYFIIEKSGSMLREEKMHLKEKVSWINSIEEISGFEGCVFSNELLDNFSVHRVMMSHELQEIFVCYDQCFKEIFEVADAPLKEYFEELDVQLQPNFCTEVNLQALNWIKSVGLNMKRGFVITIDYGFPSSELYKDCRKNGTLRCYKAHQMHDNPYINIGRQDITAHINFSSLCLWGKKYGLEFSGFTDQGHFLKALGFEDYLNKNLQVGGSRGYVLVKHILLKEMGEKLMVLIQNKSIPDFEPTGLKLAT